ncbi:hypothetical protein HHK36_010722 [Tetracentron sinense]|uniref:Uncharacterized protein n=1 Tax=Tetracentron sinense TaxID=13715 RepID=A0A835DFJ5_TETSI|nr:hypothetical protein HHK36_010722 [Tetracentron sinense]
MAHEQQKLPNSYGATAAPPPTPSTQPNSLSSSDAADALSRLFHRLPPTLSLSLPPRLSLPLISFSFSESNPNLLADLLSSSSSQLGFFQLTNHPIPSQLARSAELESLHIFDLPRDQKQQSFPIRNWPLGFDDDDDDEVGESFCFDGSCSTGSTELSLSSLREFTRAMEKLGLEIVESLSCAVGFDNPFRERATPFCSLMWVSEGHAGNKPVLSGRFYPYVIALQFQIRCQKYSLLADSGWVSVSPLVDSVMVTVGDIAQVWSNGKLKKVRGRPVASSKEDDKSRNITMSLLLTLPTDSTISPAILPMVATGGDNDDDEGQNSGGDIDSKAEKKLFCSFSFEDYAWRVYHQRLLFKDPLNRYRIK